MNIVHEVRIVAVEGLEVPADIGEGAEFVARCILRVVQVTQEQIDVTPLNGEPETLPGVVTLGCVATHWETI